MSTKLREVLELRMMSLNKVPIIMCLLQVFIPSFSLFICSLLVAFPANKNTPTATDSYMNNS